MKQDNAPIEYRARVGARETQDFFSIYLLDIFFVVIKEIKNRIKKVPCLCHKIEADV